MRRGVVCLSVLCLAMPGLVGCSIGKLHSVAPEARPLGRELRSFRAPEDPSQPAPTDGLKEPTGLLTLRHALSLALMRNPELAAFSWEVRAAEARALQATLRPNPEIDISVEEIVFAAPRTAFRTALLALELSQVIELGGKHLKRAQAAAYERDLSAWDYETARLDVYTQTAQAYVDLLAAQKRAELARKTFGLAERAHDVVNERVRAGKVASMEASKAQVELTAARVAVRRAEHDLRVARRSLAALWGSTNPRFDRVAGDLARLRPVPSLKQLARHVAQNPDIARWAAEMALRRASVRTEKANAIPDLGIGGGAEHSGETDERAGGLGLSISLPIFDRNQGGILEARHLLAKSEAERRAVEVRVKTALYRTWEALDLSHKEATALKADALPPTQRAFDAALKGYKQGKWGYLEVLDAQRSLFETQAQWIDALANYHKALADAERLIGQSLDSVANVATAVSKGASK